MTQLFITKWIIFVIEDSTCNIQLDQLVCEWLHQSVMALYSWDVAEEAVSEKYCLKRFCFLCRHGSLLDDLCYVHLGVCIKLMITLF